MGTIENRLKKVLIEFGVDQTKINRNSDYYFDLNLDMLDLMSLTKKIKSEFLVDIPDSEVLRMERISDTIYFLEKKSQFMFSYN